MQAVLDLVQVGEYFFSNKVSCNSFFCVSLSLRTNVVKFGTSLGLLSARIPQKPTRPNQPTAHAREECSDRSLRNLGRTKFHYICM